MKVIFTIFLTLLILVSITTMHNIAYADVITPLKQLEIGFTAEDVSCKENLFKVIKANNKPACVKPNSVERFVSLGWALPVNMDLVEEAKKNIKASIGTVKKIAAVPQLQQGKNLPKADASLFSYIVEACAGKQAILAPEIVVESDSEAKSYIVPQSIPANSCITSVTKIRATNVDSITATMQNKGGVSDRMTALQNKVDDLKAKISSEKEALNALELKSESEVLRGEASRITNNIVQLRAELNQAREDLNRYLFALFASPDKKSDYKGLALGGAPVKGESVTRVAITERLEGEGYNYIFEVCSGTETIRVPVVYVKSDTEEVSVRLSDKILPNTCQRSAVKIKASDINSITVTPDSNKEISTKIADLEKFISEKAQELESEKKKLNELLFKAPKPSDYELQVAEISDKIVDIRNEMNNAKALLHGYLSLVYQ